MKPKSEPALWLGAFCASLALHAAIATGLILVPASRPREPPSTNIALYSIRRAQVGEASPPLALAPVSPAAKAVTAIGQKTTAGQPPPAPRVVPNRDDLTAATPVPPSAATPVAVVPIAPETEARNLHLSFPGPTAPAARIVEPTVLTDASAAGAVASQPKAATAAPASPQRLAAPRQQGGPPAQSTARSRPVVASTVPAKAPSPSLGDQVLEAAPLKRPPAAAEATNMRQSTAGSVAPAATAPIVEPMISSRPRLDQSVASAVGSPAATATPTRPSRSLAPLQQGGSPSPTTARSRQVEPRLVPVTALPPSLTNQVLEAPPKGAGPPAVSPSGDGQVVPAIREAPEPRIAMIPPEQRLLVPARESAAEAYAKILDLISGQKNSQCFLALASAKGEAISVNGFATAAGRVSELHRRIGQLIEIPIDIRGHVVTDAQCAALAFAGGLEGYPEPSLLVELAVPEIASGKELSGRIGNLSRKRLYLVVVDDEGKVQEVQNLFLESEGTVGFRAPLTLTDGPVGTEQLLVAIASDEALETFSLQEGEQAAAFFDELRAEIRRRGNTIDFGMASVIVQ